MLLFAINILTYYAFNTIKDASDKKVILANFEMLLSAEYILLYCNISYKYLNMKKNKYQTRSCTMCCGVNFHGM
ncbi:hypothetical protein SAMN04487941_3203 [Pontibacter akesuensis]|uniref:Uncharacterized protein n=1 Tax=Pontibacter akesuensis TaxID=388950 RepID=A0A1I7JYV8_9BACT|nr:hypothetical protein SAMN04487941_3203 [Pontibacter akesuensis]